jgi:hypothetical protein
VVPSVRSFFRPMRGPGTGRATASCGAGCAAGAVGRAQSEDWLVADPAAAKRDDRLAAALLALGVDAVAVVAGSDVMRRRPSRRPYRDGDSPVPVRTFGHPRDRGGGDAGCTRTGLTPHRSPSPARLLGSARPPSATLRVVPVGHGAASGAERLRPIRHDSRRRVTDASAPFVHQPRPFGCRHYGTTFAERAAFHARTRPTPVERSGTGPSIRRVERCRPRRRPRC